MDPVMPNSSADGCGGGGGGGGEIVLFGVRVVIGDSMRKCVSLNNLSEYEQPHEDQVKGDGQERETKKGRIDVVAVGVGYASADEVVPRCNNPGTRERKRGVPWTEDEHKLFLLGLQKAGKGDWRGISKNFVKTRTPTQVASHAQKYFLRRTNLNRRRRRSSLFDLTTDSVAAMEAEQSPNQDKPATLTKMVPPAMAAPAIPPVILTVPMTQSFPSSTLEPVGSVKVAGTTIIRPIPIVPAPSTSASPFDLNLSLTSPTLHPTSLKPATTGRSDLGKPSRGLSLAFRTMPLSFSDGDNNNSNIISVA